MADAALKLEPSLAPVLLVPALRRQWPTLGAALLTGGAARTAFGEEFLLRNMLADLKTD